MRPRPVTKSWNVSGKPLINTARSLMIYGNRSQCNWIWSENKKGRPRAPGSGTMMDSLMRQLGFLADAVAEPAAAPGGHLVLTSAAARPMRD